MLLNQTKFKIPERNSQNTFNFSLINGGRANDLDYQFKQKKQQQGFFLTDLQNQKQNGQNNNKNLSKQNLNSKSIQNIDNLPSIQFNGQQAKLFPQTTNNYYSKNQKKDGIFQHTENNENNLSQHQSNNNNNNNINISTSRSKKLNSLRNSPNKQNKLQQLSSNDDFIFNSTGFRDTNKLFFSENDENKHLKGKTQNMDNLTLNSDQFKKYYNAINQKSSLFASQNQQKNRKNSQDIAQKDEQQHLNDKKLEQYQQQEFKNKRFASNENCQSDVSLINKNIVQSELDNNSQNNFQTENQNIIIRPEVILENNNLKEKIKKELYNQDIEINQIFKNQEERRAQSQKQELSWKHAFQYMKIKPLPGHTQKDNLKLFKQQKKQHNSNTAQQNINQHQTMNINQNNSTQIHNPFLPIPTGLNSNKNSIQNFSQQNINSDIYSNDLKTQNQLQQQQYHKPQFMDSKGSFNFAKSYKQQVLQKNKKSGLKPRKNNQSYHQTQNSNFNTNQSQSHKQNLSKRDQKLQIYANISYLSNDDSMDSQAERKYKDQQNIEQLKINQQLNKEQYESIQKKQNQNNNQNQNQNQNQNNTNQYQQQQQQPQQQNLRLDLQNLHHQQIDDQRYFDIDNSYQSTVYDMEIQETERIKQINFYYKTLTIKQPVYLYNNNIESLKQVKDDPLNNYGSHLLPRFFKQHMLPKIEFSQMNYKRDVDPLKKKDEDVKKRLSLKSFVNSQIPGFFENNQNNMNLQMLNNYHNPKFAQNTSYAQHQATTQILDKSIVNNNSTTKQAQNNIQIQINPLQNDVIHESAAQSRTSLEMVQSIPKRQKINSNSNKKLNFTINLQEQNKQRPNLNISHSQRKMEYSKQIQDKLKQQKLNLIYQKTTLVEQLQLARGIEYINQNLYHQAYFGIQQGKDSEIIEIFDDTLFRIFDNFNTIYKINLSKKALYYMISSFLQTKDYIRPPFVSLQKQELQEPPTHMELKIYFLSQETLFFVQNKWIKQAQSSNQEYIQGNSQKRKEMLQMWKKKVNLKYVIDKIYNRDLVFFNQQMENYLLLKTEEELNQIRSIIDVQENQIHNIENNFLIDYLNKDFNKKNIDYDEIKPDMFYKRFKNQSKVDQVKEIEFRQGEFKLVNSKQRFQSQFIEQTIEQIKENNTNKEKKNQFLQ